MSLSVPNLRRAVLEADNDADVRVLVYNEDGDLIVKELATTTNGGTLATPMNIIVDMRENRRGS